MLLLMFFPVTMQTTLLSSLVHDRRYEKCVYSKWLTRGSTSLGQSLIDY